MDWSKSKRSSFSVGSYNPHITYNNNNNNINEYERLPLQVPAPQHQLPIRSAYYETHWPLYCCDWTTSSTLSSTSTSYSSSTSSPPSISTDIVALSTYREDAINKIEIVQGSPSLVEHANGSTSDGITFVKYADANVDLPVTKLQWDPSGSEKLITTNDRLKVWDLDTYNGRLIERANLINGAQANKAQSFPPLTSFDWNKVSPNIVITSSIDTTCTVWDLNHPSAPKTQLIAHDSEVFDVQFLKGSSDIFASVGCDGSMRVFDLRALEHSTIIYEPPASAATSTTATNSSASSDLQPSQPPPSSSSSSLLSSNYANNPPGSLASGNSPSLLRLACSNTDNNIIATFAAKSDSINIMDMRYPGLPTCILNGHSGAINSIKWHPTQSKLLSGGDDCQALVWDFTAGGAANNSAMSQKMNVSVDHPDYVYGDTFEVNNVSWNATGDWFGVVAGKGFQGVKA